MITQRSGFSFSELVKFELAAFVSKASQSKLIQTYLNVAI